MRRLGTQLVSLRSGVLQYIRKFKGISVFSININSSFKADFPICFIYFNMVTCVIEVFVMFYFHYHILMDIGSNCLEIESKAHFEQRIYSNTFKQPVSRSLKHIVKYTTHGSHVWLSWLYSENPGSKSVKPEIEIAEKPGTC